jgi:DHA2 family multidrug resistance protein
MSNTAAINKSSSSPAPTVGLKTWIGLIGAMLGAFMAVLDIQITNSSLQEIQPA